MTKRKSYNVAILQHALFTGKNLLAIDLADSWKFKNVFKVKKSKYELK